MKLYKKHQKQEETIGNFSRQWETNWNEYFGPMSKGRPQQYKNI